MQNYVAARLSILPTETASVQQIQVNINREYQQISATYKLIQKTATLSPNGSSAAPLNSLISLPSDCLEIESMQFSTNVPVIATPEQIAQLYALTAAGVVWWGSPTLPMYYWYESPQTIQISPPADLTTPTGTVWYIAKPPDLVNPTDQMQYTNPLGVTTDVIPEPWHVWVCERAIVAMALNEQDVYGAELTSGLRADKMEKDFETWIRRRRGKVPAKMELPVYNTLT